MRPPSLPPSLPCLTLSPSLPAGPRKQRPWVVAQPHSCYNLLGADGLPQQPPLRHSPTPDVPNPSKADRGRAAPSQASPKPGAPQDPSSSAGQVQEKLVELVQSSHPSAHTPTPPPRNLSFSSARIHSALAGPLRRHFLLPPSKPLLFLVLLQPRLRPLLFHNGVGVQVSLSASPTAFAPPTTPI